MGIAKPHPDVRFSEQVGAAPFIFTGQIVRPGGTTVAALAPDDRLAIVRVEMVFRAPAILGVSKGMRLTIQLASRRPMKAGAKALFYATSWLYGDGIAVVEVARAGVPSDAKGMLASVVQAELQLEDDKLSARLRRAELVVSGMVDETSPADREQRGPTSEHDPLWWRADIAVDRIEKGKMRETRVVGYFPASLDEYWIDVPKLQPRQRGVFILHREIGGKHSRLQPPGLAILDPLDFQPSPQLGRVRALLKLASA